jgi:hypothetical protein
MIMRVWIGLSCPMMGTVVISYEHSTVPVDSMKYQNSLLR